MTAFMIFLIGGLLVIGGVGYALTLMGVAASWIGIAIAVMLGVFIVSGAGLTKRKKPDNINVSASSD